MTKLRDIARDIIVIAIGCVVAAALGVVAFINWIAGRDEGAGE